MTLETRDLWKAASSVADAYRLWLTGETGAWLTRDSEVEGHLRDLIGSIHYRYDSILFHVRLLEQATADAQDRPDLHRQEHPRLRWVATQHQYVFDDLVFNTMSLFDYVGCLAGLVLEGVGSRAIKWSRARGKIKALAPGSRAAVAMREANRYLVAKFEQYRSQLIHHFRDDVDGWIRRDLLQGTSELTITVPEWFVALVDLPDINSKTPMPEAGRHVADLAGTLARDVLRALAEDLQEREWATAPPNPHAMVARWRRHRFLDRLAEDQDVRAAGVTGCGAAMTDRSLALILDIDGTSVESAPIELDPLFNNGAFEWHQIESVLRATALSAVAKTGEAHGS